jgi:hypothetical protein
MATCVDNDTLEAVAARWKQVPDTLPALFKQPPATGRLHGTQSSPYAQVTSEFSKHDSAGTGGAWHDWRKVTITVRGLKDDVRRGVEAVLEIFDDRTTLVYPSGARFIRWWPQGDRLEQEETTKDGQDVWMGVVEGEVWSVRPA